MNRTVLLSLLLDDAVQMIEQSIVKGSWTGSLIDSYTLPAAGVGTCVVLVFEKHYYRAGNRLTLTVTVDDFEGQTRMHCAGGGGGAGLFRFDWGAAGSFENFLLDAFQQYIVSPVDSSPEN